MLGLKGCVEYEVIQSEKLSSFYNLLVSKVTSAVDARSRSSQPGSLLSVFGTSCLCSFRGEEPNSKALSNFFPVTV